jgi:hypothetical protein
LNDRRPSGRSLLYGEAFAADAKPVSKVIKPVQSDEFAVNRASALVADALKPLEFHYGVACRADGHLLDSMIAKQSQGAVVAPNQDPIHPQRASMEMPLGQKVKISINFREQFFVSADSHVRDLDQLIERRAATFVWYIPLNRVENMVKREQNAAPNDLRRAGRGNGQSPHDLRSFFLSVRDRPMGNIRVHDSDLSAPQCDRVTSIERELDVAEIVVLNLFPESLDAATEFAYLPAYTRNDRSHVGRLHHPGGLREHGILHSPSMSIASNPAIRNRITVKVL